MYSKRKHEKGVPIFLQVLLPDFSEFTPGESESFPARNDCSRFSLLFTEFALEPVNDDARSAIRVFAEIKAKIAVLAAIRPKS
jgi:hypothetical protein